MKSVFIVFNQANTERVEYMLDQLKISGFTFFEHFVGCFVRQIFTGRDFRVQGFWFAQKICVLCLRGEAQGYNGHNAQKE